MSDELTGDALDERARELDIHGRGSMTADEKRAAIAAAEAAADRDVPNDDDPAEDARVQAGLETGDASLSHRVLIEPPVTKN